MRTRKRLKPGSWKGDPGKRPVILEIEVRPRLSITAGWSRRDDFLGDAEEALRGFPVEIDTDYSPVFLGRRPGDLRPAPSPFSHESISVLLEQPTGFVRATIDPKARKRLKDTGKVVAVWDDGPIYPLRGSDCDAEEAKGTLDDVAEIAGAKALWKAGFHGEGIVIGIVDEGVDKDKFAVVDGWSPDPKWPWGSLYELDDEELDHGMMCATDAVGMAPKANILDIGLLRHSRSRGWTPFLSDALKAMEWTLHRYFATGTPHILSNSWGIYDWKEMPDYAKRANHPLHRAVKAAVGAGIIVTFAAGNCGPDCPSDGCGGKNIWGASGLPEVITLGAVNPRDEWIGYSSVGPSPFTKEKPDLCSYSHFKGYFESDNGTSAACPIASGLLALLKQASPTMDPVKAQQILIQTARKPKGLRAAHSPKWGHGIIDAWGAAGVLDPKLMKKKRRA